MSTKITNYKRARRSHRVRTILKSISDVPRLSVFRSNKHIYAQLIDDVRDETIASASSSEVLNEKKEKGKSIIASLVGGKIAEKALRAGVKKAVFDRGSYRYHGRVKALAEAARLGGLKI